MDKRCIRDRQGNAAREGNFVFVGSAGFIDDFQLEQGGDGVDQAGAADPYRGGFVDGMHLQRTVFRRDLVDGPGNAAAAAGDARALEGRARGCLLYTSRCV